MVPGPVASRLPGGSSITCGSSSINNSITSSAATRHRHLSSTAGAVLGSVQQVSAVPRAASEGAPAGLSQTAHSTAAQLGPTACATPEWLPHGTSDSAVLAQCAGVTQMSDAASAHAAVELVAAASASEVPGAELAAAAGPGQPAAARAAILRSAAAAVEGLHDMTGLPWWASIPLASLCLRTALLPFSMWQAKAVRTNYLVYKEAVGLTDKQLGTAGLTQQQGAKAEAAAQPGVPDLQDEAERQRRLKLLLSNFGLLRRKLGAPHPGWVLVNPLIQLPCFVVLGATLRMMGGVGWPGLAMGGTLWFPDLTQVALVPGALSTLPDVSAWAWPMGVWGPLLPLTLLAMTLTSLRMGFGAAGTLQADAAPPQDWIGRGMRVLPRVLAGLAGLNTWVALQLPHAALLHWLASASFTLGLQNALQRPGFRAAFNLPTPLELQATLSRVVNQRLQQLSEQGGVLGPGRGYSLSTLPDSVLKQVSGERSADVLVILGAQHSAAKRYREALYCLDRALQMDPSHVRAHYARGQVFSLNGRWGDAEACYRQAAALAPPGPEQGQALYCVATALHTQGNLAAAVPLYQQAAGLWPQPVVPYALANALVQLGRLEEARKVVLDVMQPQAVQGPAAVSGAPALGPFWAPLDKLLNQIDRLMTEQKDDLARRDQG